MNLEIITEQDIEGRWRWVDEISRLSGNFEVASSKVEQEISKEIEKDGIAALIAHLRLCGSIPEKYGHDSSEEKLYSKYTDIVIHKAFAEIGCKSLVLGGRADAADVQCVCGNYSFVADAKAFRMSRTAKNQKDFKVQAMDNWKGETQFAMIVCPVYHLPSRTSQIYRQAAERSVCICTYTHLAVLVRYGKKNRQSAIELLHNIFKAVKGMKPSKDADTYWRAINRILLDADKEISNIWEEEKIASLESIQLARNEALGFLESEIERIKKLSREEVIEEFIKSYKITNRMRAIESVVDNGLLNIV